MTAIRLFDFVSIQTEIEVNVNAFTGVTTLVENTGVHIRFIVLWYLKIPNLDYNRAPSVNMSIPSKRLQDINHIPMLLKKFQDRICSFH